MTVRTIAYDTFTEAGTSTTVNITSHTPEAGGSWSPATEDVNCRFYIDATTDQVRLGAVTSFPGGQDMSLLSAKAWNMDAFATVTRGASGSGGAGPQLRCIGTSSSKSSVSWVGYFGVGSSGNVAIYRKNTTYTLVSSVSKSVTDPAKVRFRAIGSSPTTLQLRVWAASGTEPDAWDVNTTDNTSSNQTAAEAAFGVYMEAQSASVYATVTEFSAVQLSGQSEVRLQSVTRSSSW